MSRYYVNFINVSRDYKKYIDLFQFLSYLQACCTYYHQGADLSEDLEPFLKTTADDVRIYMMLMTLILYKWTEQCEKGSLRGGLCPAMGQERINQKRIDAVLCGYFFFTL